MRCRLVCLWLGVLLTVLCRRIPAAEIERAADAPQPLSPQESAACIRLPEGLRIELVASEPLIQEPSCIAFDEYGRLFVTELHGYNVEGELDVAELNKTGQLDREVRCHGSGNATAARIIEYGVTLITR